MKIEIEHNNEKMTFDATKRYSNGRVAVRIYTEIEPICNLSVNVPEIPLSENMFILDQTALRMEPDLIKMLVRGGLIKESGLKVSYGHVEDSPVYELIQR